MGRAIKKLMPSPQLLSKPDAARALGGVSLDVIERLVNKGQFVRVMIGHRAMVSVDSIDAYIARGGSAAASGDAA